MVKHIKENYREAALGGKDRAMLDYALKLTLKPNEVQAQEVQELRACGFTDADILDTALVTSYYNFVNRVAQGLGVELES